jgi:hypothetical protein
MGKNSPGQTLLLEMGDLLVQLTLTPGCWLKSLHAPPKDTRLRRHAPYILHRRSLLPWGRGGGGGLRGVLNTTSTILLTPRGPGAQAAGVGFRAFTPTKTQD